MFELVRALALDAAAGAAQGYAVVPADHPLLRDAGEFRRHVPETWLLEIMAQVAGPLAEAVSALGCPSPRWALLGMVRRARFHQRLPLAVRMDVRAEALRRAQGSVTLGVQVWHERCRCADAEIVMMLVETPLELTEAKQARSSRLQAWLDAWRSG